MKAVITTIIMLMNCLITSSIFGMHNTINLQDFLCKEVAVTVAATAGLIGALDGVYTLP